MHLFYTPLLEGEHTVFQLDEAESKHAVRVLRLGKESRIGLLNGKGLKVEGEILDANPKRVVLKILYPSAMKPVESHFHLCIAPTKNMDRLEWLVEKATEIGIGSITPLICARSERKEVSIERLQKVAIAAMKQAQRTYLPVIHPAIKFNAWMAGSETLSGQKWIAHCLELPKTPLVANSGSDLSVHVLIGPEGDFSVEEVDFAVSKGFFGLDLGDWRLRTETAGLVACMEVSRFERNLSI